MSDRIYVGNAVEIETKYGPMHKIVLFRDNVQDIQEAMGDTGKVSILLKRRREESKAGFTHYLEVDRYEPQTEEVSSDDAVEDSKEDDIPF